MRTYARITGWGKYLPERVVTNHELEKTLNTSDEWIRSRSGIGERRIVADHETASVMATGAAREALCMAGLLPGEVDLILVATCTSDMVFPACASQVQHALGAGRAGALDVNAACSGFVYALAVGTQFIASGMYRNVLVIGSEAYSRIVDWSDRNTCVLFGDGAGAIVLQASDTPTGPMNFVLGSDGSGADQLYVPSFTGAPHTWPEKGRPYLKMNGREVFKFAVRIVCEITEQVVKEAGLEIADLDLLIPHQANERIISAAARGLGIPMEKVLMDLDVYGNTSSASIPIAICDAVDRGMLREGSRAAIVGFGGGLSWAASLLQWGVREEAVSLAHHSRTQNVTP